MAKTEVRERIAEAAWRLFDEKGYENEMCIRDRSRGR